MKTENFSAPVIGDRTPLELAIAEAMTSMYITSFGGTCAWYNLLGHIVLKEHGIDTKLIRGGMLYRAGSNGLDVVAWCDQHNKARGNLHHFWLETDNGELIDFSCLTWRSLTDNDPTVPPGFPKVNWEKLPPQYVWAPRNAIVDNPHRQLPRIGKAFYNIAEVIEHPEEYLDDVESITAMLPGIRSRIEMLAA